ncbi:MAG: DUF5674 family protein [Parcubacteria group bacterium]
MKTYIIKESITLARLREIAQEGFGDIVKAVVDIEQDIMALSGELHIDEEVKLIEEEGTKKENAWGVNIYPDGKGDDFIEFDSMINLKPASGNRTRNIENLEIRQKIKNIVRDLIKE